MNDRFSNRLSVQGPSSGPPSFGLPRERLDLDAVGDDPELSVSTVANYAFCPLAGVITHEGEFSEEDEEVPSLGGLPWYEQDAIEQRYVAAVYWLFGLAIVYLIGMSVLAFLFVGTLFFPVSLAIVTFGWIVAVKPRVVEWWALAGRRRLAFAAKKCEPNPNSAKSESVDWWGLLRAGFEVRRDRRRYKNVDLRLGGKPSRVLVYHSMVIPVHRINKEEGPLLPQHVVRMMALCHLIESQEGAVSPFGIVLFANSYEGLTVPNVRINREKFYDALKRCRVMIRESDRGEREPSKPVTDVLCKNCPFGRSRPLRLKVKTSRHGESIDPFLLGLAGKLFHCDCGDRFRWKPLHHRNRKMQTLSEG